MPPTLSPPLSPPPPIDLFPLSNCSTTLPLPISPLSPIPPFVHPMSPFSPPANVPVHLLFLLFLKYYFKSHLFSLVVYINMATIQPESSINSLFLSISLNLSVSLPLISPPFPFHSYYNSNYLLNSSLYNQL